MDLHGCPRCAAVEVDWAEALVDRDGSPARRYHGTCPGCGQRREFVFALPDRPTPPRTGAPVTFGAEESASELLDAGQWVELADMMALAAGLTDVTADESRESLAIAVACLDEVLKFVPPGAGEVPPSAFWTDAGRRVRDRSPQRFRRADLEDRRADLAGRR
jgi:hypothetical protein